MAASLLLAVLFLSACLYARRRAVLRKGIGLMLLGGSCLPFSFAFTILSPVLNTGSRLAVTSWSAGGMTLKGWQMYAGAGLFALATFSMVAGGTYFILWDSNDD